jgi:hypothetical protein
MLAQSSSGVRLYAYTASSEGVSGEDRLPVSLLATIPSKDFVYIESYFVLTPCSTTASRSWLAVLLDSKFVTINGVSGGREIVTGVRMDRGVHRWLRHDGHIS